MTWEETKVLTRVLAQADFKTYINILNIQQLISENKDKESILGLGYTEEEYYAALTCSVETLKTEMRYYDTIPDVMERYVREYKINTIQNLIKKGCSKEFVLDLEFTEEEFEAALNNKIPEPRYKHLNNLHDRDTFAAGEAQGVKQGMAQGLSQAIQKLLQKGMDKDFILTLGYTEEQLAEAEGRIRNAADKWDIALGLIKVDGLEPTPEFLELVEKEKAGEISTDDIRHTLNKKYNVLDYLDNPSMYLRLRERYEEGYKEGLKEVAAEQLGMTVEELQKILEEG